MARNGTVPTLRLRWLDLSRRAWACHLVDAGFEDWLLRALEGTPSYRLLPKGGGPPPPPRGGVGGGPKTAPLNETTTLIDARLRRESTVVRTPPRGGGFCRSLG